MSTSQKATFKTVKLNPFIHKQLKLAATDLGFPIAAYANVILARKLRIIPDEPDMSVADIMDDLNAMYNDVKEQPEPALETAELNRY